MKRRRKYDEHDNHEAWAIPYGDLVTLLLAFFVVMYSISSVNTGKYRVLSSALTAAFRGTPLSPQAIGFNATASGVSEQLPSSELNRIFSTGLPEHALAPQAHSSALLEAEAARAKELDAIAIDVSGVMRSLIQSNAVQVKKTGDAVEVQISADILFASGMAEPAPAAVPVLQHLADALKTWPNAVQVEGHTDNVPVRSGAFRSNWELSGARAGSVVRLFSEHGVDPQRLAVVGYGQYRPLQSNSDAAGRNANRRVAIIILGSKPERAALRP
ncbi:MAG: flagellar motor protein MotD [Steroidobacteraceae bacterium]